MGRVCVLIPPVFAVNMASIEEERLGQLAGLSGRHAAAPLRAKSLRAIYTHLARLTAGVCSFTPGHGKCHHMRVIASYKCAASTVVDLTWGFLFCGLGVLHVYTQQQCCYGQLSKINTLISYYKYKIQSITISRSGCFWVILYMFFSHVSIGQISRQLLDGYSRSPEDEP